MIRYKLEQLRQQLQKVEQTEQVIRLKGLCDDILLLIQQQDELENELNLLADKYEKSGAELEAKIKVLERNRLYS